MISYLDNVVSVKLKSSCPSLSRCSGAGVLHTLPDLILTTVKLDAEAQRGSVPGGHSLCVAEPGIKPRPGDLLAVVSQVVFAT